MSKTDPELFCPANRQEWRLWLEKNHVKKDFIWLVQYKSGAAKSNLSWSEAVDEALCFGWIDSTRRTIDSDKFKQYFSKRKAKSNWSKINKDKVELLIKYGLMTKAGFNSIEIAKKNGSWNYLDDVEALIIPEDLKHAFNLHPGSEDFFMNLSKSVMKMMLYWIHSAKRPETRENRIREIVENAEKGLKPKHIS